MPKDRVEIQFNANNLDTSIELDYLKDDVERSVKAADTRQTGTQATTVEVAG